MKKIYTLIVMLALVSTVTAENISKEQALQIASQFMNNKAMASAKGIAGFTASAAYVAESTDGHYIVNSDNGFVIVAADDAVSKQVLGYSTSGCFDAANAPDGLKAMLAGYDSEIAYMKANGIKSEPKNTVEREPIELSTPLWNQELPYNQLCPKVGDTIFPCATGCGATAIAEIMYYFKWPKDAYNWDAMKQVYDESRYDDADSTIAVATLMHDVGVASDMKYNIVSNTTPAKLVTAITETFDYSKDAILLQRSDFTSDEWEEIVYKNLQVYGPLQYNGYGHAFVCEGYKDGFFRFNWGWGGGGNDAYFSLTNLVPDVSGTGSSPTGDYTPYQSAIFNIHPNDGKTYSWKAGAPTVLPAKGNFEMIELECPDEFLTTGDFHITGKMRNPSSDFMMQDIGVVVLDKDADPSALDTIKTPVYIQLMAHVECNGGDTVSFQLNKPINGVNAGEYKVIVMNPDTKYVFATKYITIVTPTTGVQLLSRPELEFVDNKNFNVKLNLGNYSDNDSIAVMITSQKIPFAILALKKIKVAKEVTVPLNVSDGVQGYETIYVSVAFVNNGLTYIYYSGDVYFDFNVPYYTGVNDIYMDKPSQKDGHSGAEKYIKDNRIIIERNNRIYDAIGRKIE